MNKEEILKQVREYYEMELHNVELVTTRQTWAGETGRISATVNAALSRCLGVALFVQQLDIDYEAEVLHNNAAGSIGSALLRSRQNGDCQF